MPSDGPRSDAFDALADVGADQDGQGPRLFVRAITTLPAPPWDQGAAARLEARLNAPLPLNQVTFITRRLDRWRPGAPGAFAAVYARHEDVSRGLITTAYLDGRPIPVSFPVPGRKLQHARLFGVSVAAGAVAALLAVSTVAMVLSARAEAAARLEMLEQAVARRMREAKAAEVTNARLQAIEAAGLEDRRAAVAVADLDWAAAARTPNARVESLIKSGGVLAAEARGEAAPFQGVDRKIERYRQPLRRGVWLWTIGDRPAEDGL